MACHLLLGPQVFAIDIRMNSIKEEYLNYAKQSFFLGCTFRSCRGPIRDVPVAIGLW